jgi:flagellar hook protein FlgE
MMRSLYSGVSGLKNHQARMDVIGNNISNVNTTAYKSSRVIFQDIYSQTLKAASAGTATLGGTNPAQIGLGVSLGDIDILFNSAAMQRTDNPSDLAIEGEGFFVVDTNGTDAGGMFYTRAGTFYVDNAGYLVTSDGYFIMGDDPTATPAESAFGADQFSGLYRNHL